MTVVKGHFRNEICVALFHDLKLAEKSFLSMPLGRYSIVYDIFGFSRISRFAARRGLCLMQMRVSSWAGTKHRRTHSSHLSARVFSAMFYLLHL
jgi:hypothetical protein